MRIASPAEREAFENEIAAAPTRWPVVGGTGGVRKARVMVGGRGKRGGARAIYYFHSRGSVVYMLTIYAKDEQEDLSEADKKAIKAIATEIKKVEDAAFEAPKAAKSESRSKGKAGRQT